MPQISNLSQLLNLVRSSDTSSLRRSRAARASSANTQKTSERKLSRVELKRVLGKRLNTLEADTGSLDDRQIMQLFVETLLVWEFGEDILRGANAQRISDKICDQVMANTTLREQIKQVMQAARR